MRFEILDDGRPRIISSFTVEQRTPVKGVENGPARSAFAQPEPLSGAPARTAVFLFDDLHISISALKTLSESDMAAVVTISGTNRGLTRDHQKLQDAILKLKPLQLYDPSASDCRCPLLSSEPDREPARKPGHC